MIKCIAIDMDGTLLNEHHVISNLNKEAIEFAQSKGIEVVIATGRSYHEAKYALDEVGIKTPIICVNGAEVRSISGESVYASPISTEVTLKIMEVLDESKAYYELYTAEGTYSKDYEQGLMIIMDIFMSPNQKVNYEETLAEAKKRFENGLIHLVKDFYPIVTEMNEPVYKLISFSFDQNVLKDLMEKLKSIDGIALSSSGKENIEINSIDAQKGIALTEFVKQKGISLEETMAIGDNFNDVSMFKRVGRAVAMGNAPEDVKKHSHFITEPNSDDGVGKEILRVLEG